MIHVITHISGNNMNLFKTATIFSDALGKAGSACKIAGPKNIKAVESIILIYYVFGVSLFFSKCLRIRSNVAHTLSQS